MDHIEMNSEKWDSIFIPIMDGESYKDFHPKTVNDEDKKILEKALGENKVWTLMDGDNGDNLYLINGLHFVNRIDVYITENPYDSEKNYTIDWND